MLEANPSSTEAKRFKDYFIAGVNRLSLGIQSLKSANLTYLGRSHNVNDAKYALKTAAKIFDRISFDMIYGLPGQKITVWHEELAEALEFAHDHLSVYQLTIEPGTAFFRTQAKNTDENLAADIFTFPRQHLEAAGFPAYEVSNHARVDGESRCGQYGPRYRQKASAQCPRKGYRNDYNRAASHSRT